MKTTKHIDLTHHFQRHGEIILVAPSASIFSKGESSNQLFDVDIETVQDHRYTDLYFDTPEKDIHGSSSTLRYREFESSYPGNVNSIEYKGAPSYLHQLILARAYGTTPALDSKAASDILKLKTLAEPMQFLYADRPDILGKPLASYASAKVTATVRLFSRNGKRIPVAIAFHQYILSCGDWSTSHQYLVELQPRVSSGSNLLRYIPYFKHLVNEFQSMGYRLSPVSKYHRVPRDKLDVASS